MSPLVVKVPATLAGLPLRAALGGLSFLVCASFCDCGGAVMRKAVLVLALVGLRPAVILAEPADVPLAIVTLQPRVSPERAERLGALISALAAEYDFDPLLLVALVMRESSFRPDIENLEAFGAAGEIGLMQIHPRGPWRNHLPAGCTARLEGAACQLRVGVAWLAWARDWCPGVPARWLTAYGRGRCLPEAEAVRDPGVLRALSLWRRLRD